MKYILMLITVLISACTVEQEIFKTDMYDSCGYSIYLGDNYNVITKGCMDSPPIVYVFNSRGLVTKFLMSPFFGGISRISHDTIWYKSYNIYKESQYPYENKSRFKFMVISCDARGESTIRHNVNHEVDSLSYDKDRRKIILYSCKKEQFEYAPNQVYFEFGNVVCKRDSNYSNDIFYIKEENMNLLLVNIAKNTSVRLKLSPFQVKGI